MKIGTDARRAATQENTGARGKPRYTAMHAIGLATVMLAAGTALDAGRAARAAEMPIAAAGTADTMADTAVAQQRETRDFSIPAQRLPAALDAFAEQAGISFAYRTGDFSDLDSTGVSGTMTRDRALARLLSGTGITWRFTDANTVTLARTGGDSATVLDPVLVEGRDLTLDPGRTEDTQSYSGSQVSVGSKTATSIREIPQSVSVVTRQRMEDQNLTTLQDAMNETTGMTVQKFDGAGHFNTINARGFSTDTYLLDGVPTTAHGNLATSLDTAIYDRIEVLRGPAGLFEGAGEPSASINLVRKRPDKDFDVSVAATGGSWNTRRLEGDVSVPLVSTGRVRARTVAVVDDRESYIDVVEAKKRLAYGTIEMDLSPDMTLAFGGTYQDIDSVMDQGLPAYDDGTFADVSRSTYTGANWNKQDMQAEDYFAELQHSFDNGARLQASMRYLDRDMLYRAARANSAIDASTGDFDIQTVEYSFNRQSFSGDVHGSTPFAFAGRTHKFLIGADYHTYTNTTTSLAYGPTFTSNIFNPTHDFEQPEFDAYTPAETEQDQYGTYSQLRVKPTDWGTLILGGRLSWWESRSSTSTQTRNAEVTPYFGLIADLTDQFSLYGSYASIFKPQTQTTVSGDFLEPRTGDQYEVGLKGDFYGGGLIGHLAAYRIEDKNRALSDPDNPGSSIAAGEVRSEGFEAEISGMPYPGWDVVAGYAYTTTEYIEAAQTDEGKTFATFTPEHSINLWNKYTFTGGELDGLHLAGGAKWVSEFYSESGGVRFVEDGYMTVSAQVGYRFSPTFRGTFTITNLFDEEYFSKVSSASRQNFYGEPRAFMFHLRATW